MSILDKIGKIVQGESVGKVISDAIEKDIPWDDLVVTTSITNIRHALSKASPTERKQIVNRLLTGLCRDCMRAEVDCGCHRSRALKKR